MAIIIEDLDQNAVRANWESWVGASYDLPAGNILYFSIVKMLLWGRIGGKTVGPYTAQSGGGLTLTPSGKMSASFNDLNPCRATGYASRNEISDDNRGGAIVPGLFAVPPDVLKKGRMHKASVWGGAPTGNSLRLYPVKIEKRYGALTRNSFYIHGNGGKGSDGCIIMGPTDRQQLIDHVKAGKGAWLRAYLSSRELEKAYEESDAFNRTA